MSRSSQAKQKQRTGPALLEWISAAIGALIAVGIVGFIAADAIRSDADTPPLISVEPTRTVSKGRSHVVELVVRNQSGQTAAAVLLEGELKSGDRTIEKSTAQVSYVPGNSEVRGGVIFTHDPGAYQLDVRAVGYEKP